jgi:hypothetical protein
MLHHYQKMAELGLPHVMKSDVPDYGMVRFIFILQLWQKMLGFSNQVHCAFSCVAFHICLAEGQCIYLQGCIGSIIFSFFLSFTQQTAIQYHH